MMLNAIDTMSRWAIPMLITVTLVVGHLRGVKLYECFVQGAAEGLKLAVMIVPYLVGIFAALGVFRASGALDLLAEGLGFILRPLGIPPEILPLMLIRPLSGGGALAVSAELIQTHGPDSFIGRLASVMQGSTDTTFFILTFYFGSVGIRKTRHAMMAGLTGDLAGFLAATMVCHLLFG